MTTYRKGADPEALADIARSIRGLRAELTRIEGTARAAVRVVEANAGGSRLASLSRDFTGRSLPSLQACGRVLDDMARRIDANVAAQRQVSGLGGHTPGGPAGGGGGGGRAGGGRREVGLNPEQTFPGHRTPLRGREQDDSVGGDGNHFRHTTYGPVHAWENSRRDEGSDVARYERYTHAGDSPDSPRLNHARGYRYEHEEVFAPGAREEDRTTAQRARDAVVGGVNWTHKETSEDPNVRYYDADGNPTDKAHAVRLESGLLMGTASTTESEHGLKDGALYAGGTALAGAYLAKGSVAGNLGEHGRYSAKGHVGAEAKATAGASLGKDGLRADAKAEASVGVRGEAAVSGRAGILRGSAAGHAMAGAEAKAEASVSVGKDGISTRMGGEAFAGAKAGVDVGGSVAGIGGTAGAEVRAGIGASASLDGELSADRIALNMEVGLVLGIGGEVRLGVDISPQEFIEDAGLDDFADGFGSAASGLKDDVGDLIGTLF